MLKFLTVVRTVVLGIMVVAIIYTGGFSVYGTGTATVGVDTARNLAKAAWVATGWIALETVAGWVVLWVKKPKAAKPAGPPVSPAPQA